MSFFENNRIRLHYESYGATSAQPIVLIMGLGMPFKMWPDSLIAGLMRSGFRVIVVDNRDCGQSKFFDEHNVRDAELIKSIGRALLRLPVPALYSLNDMAADIEALLDHLQIRRSHVMGFSMGGMIAQVFATNYPNRVASLISMSSAVGNPKTGLGKMTAIYSILRGNDDFTSKKEVIEHAKKVMHCLEGSLYREKDREIESFIKEKDWTGYHMEGLKRQLLAILASGDRSSQLCQVCTPSLIIHGTEDPLLPFQAGKETAELLCQSRFLPIQGLGHQLPLSLVPLLVKEVTLHCMKNPV